VDADLDYKVFVGSKQMNGQSCNRLLANADDSDDSLFVWLVAGADLF
jgi:hypothetical protein